jgi:hypothetical protein
MREVSVAANATDENILSGSAFEFTRQRSVVSMAVVQAATGTFATINNGPQVVAEEHPPEIKTNYPEIPDDFFYVTPSATGDRLVIRIRNTTGAPIVVRAIAQITPV